MSKLVLIRHGESICNKNNIFTGWLNSPLTDKGKNEARLAGKRLKKYDFNFDIAYTSVLDRANDTLNLVLNELNLKNVPITKTWMLNERHYGALEGMNKDEARNIFGSEQVQRWRRGLTDFPPKISLNDPKHPMNDELYKDINPNLLPSSENLESVNVRVINYFENNIKKDIENGKDIIIVAHQNSLRSLISHIEKLNTDEMLKIELPNAVPIVYEIDSELNILNKEYLNSEDTL